MQFVDARNVMKKISLPEYVSIGHFKIYLTPIDHDVAYNVCEMQGCFLSKPPYQIYLDKDIIDRNDVDSKNLVIHELCHAIYYIYLLKDKDEESIVNGMSNGITELFYKSELKEWLKSCDG